MSQTVDSHYGSSATVLFDLHIFIFSSLLYFYNDFACVYMHYPKYLIKYQTDITEALSK